MAEPVANQLEVDLQRLSIGILYLMVGRGTLDFPTTSAAHPSYWVVVNRTVGPLLRPEDARIFPFQVRWHLWENLVVPIWQDPALHVRARGIGVGGRNYKNLTALQLGQVGDLLLAIRKALAVQAGNVVPGSPVVAEWSKDPLELVEQPAELVGGYLPKQPSSGIVPTPAGAGEPVNPVGTGNPVPWAIGLQYQVFDEE